jgi:hypothetical protein
MMDDFAKATRSKGVFRAWEGEAVVDAELPSLRYSVSGGP